MDQEKINLIREMSGKPFHYYGDTVRRLFVAAALLMLVTLPFFTERLPVPTFVSIIVIILLSVAAGLFAPRSKGVIWFNQLISIVGIFFFEHYAVKAYKTYAVSDSLFIVNQIIAIIFLFALYYASKTLRSLNHKENR